MASRPTLVRPVAPVHDRSIFTERELERQRSRSVQRTGVLLTEKEERFDQITRLACDHFGVSGAAITFIMDDQQYMKSVVGADVSVVPRKDALCAVTVMGDGPLVVPDLTRDPRFSDNPFVRGPAHLRFYAGVPVRGPGGWFVGTMCLLHTAPRDLDAAELGRLIQFAEQVQLELNVADRTDG